ncbi:hypothetical protein Hypma_001860 [Hypsizygus marmoreus]|uniref:F-box domain-containing protein n=1 Tax=Hypsizygus marmoreus TaxID=39966 RepID=A0A369J9C1_HYPMA|nr:hypothetical protein Hypma_001860 [Hypsizygus marmoreus]
MTPGSRKTPQVRVAFAPPRRLLLAAQIKLCLRRVLRFAFNDFRRERHVSHDAPQWTNEDPNLPLASHKINLELYSHSSIACLPVETLSEIFLHCLADLSVDPLYVRIENGPLLLSHVCGYWRHLALSMSTLWTSFCPEPRNRVRGSYINLVEQWLERSQPLPVSFSLSVASSETRELLLANAHRWYNIELTPDDDLISDFLAAAPSAPLTEAVTIYAVSGELTKHDGTPVILRSFPHLRRLTYWTGRESPQDLLANVPWAGLTHITLYCQMPMDVWLAGLKQCREARYIDIRMVQPSPPLRSGLVTLPKLEYLEVGVRDGDSFLDQLVLPSLHTFKFDFSRIPSRAFRDLVTRSDCTLETLCISDQRLSESELIGFITHPGLRGLRELDVNGVRILDETIKLLTYPSDTEGILPHLERLYLRNIGAIDGLVSDMVASRWPPSQDRDLPLSFEWVSVHFSRRRLALEKDHLRLKEFLEQGLRVSWSWR